MSYDNSRLSRTLVDMLLLGIASADAQQADLAILVSTIEDTTVPPPPDGTVTPTVDVAVDAK